MASDNGKGDNCSGSCARTYGAGNLLIILVKFGHKKINFSRYFYYSSGVWSDEKGREKSQKD